VRRIGAQTAADGSPPRSDRCRRASAPWQAHRDRSKLGGEPTRRWPSRQRAMPHRAAHVRCVGRGSTVGRHVTSRRHVASGGTYASGGHDGRILHRGQDTAPGRRRIFPATGSISEQPGLEEHKRVATWRRVYRCAPRPPACTRDCPVPKHLPGALRRAQPAPARGRKKKKTRPRTNASDRSVDGEPVAPPTRTPLPPRPPHVRVVGPRVPRSGVLGFSTSRRQQGGCCTAGPALHE